MIDRKKPKVLSFIRGEVLDVFNQLKRELREDEPMFYKESNKELKHRVDQYRAQMAKKVDDGQMSIEELSKFALVKLKKQ